MGRGHVSRLTNLDTRHSKPFRYIGHLLIYSAVRQVATFYKLPHGPHLGKVTSQLNKSLLQEVRR